MHQCNDGNNFMERIVDQYTNMLLRIAYQNLKHSVDAEDVVQEVFMKLIKQPEFQDEQHLKAWLIRVTINLCKDFNKSAWRRKIEPLTDIMEPLQEEQQNVLDEVFKLPEHYRNVIYLYYYEDYSVHEIADILHKKENTVRSQLTRAKRKLKYIILERG